MSEAMLAHAVTFGLANARIGGLLVAMPWLSQIIAARIRVVLCLLLGVVVTLQVGPTETDATLSTLGLMAVKELAIGLGSGLLLRIMVSAVEIAGQLSGLQLSLGFAGTIDPLLREESSPMSQLWAACVAMVFFAAGGLEAVFGVVLAGFSVMSPGHALMPGPGAFVQATGLAFSQALVIAMPIFAGAIIMQVALALIARAEPELNVYGLAFGALTLLGIFLFAETLGDSVAVGRELAREAPHALAALIRERG